MTVPNPGRNWRQEVVDGVTLLRCAILHELRGVAHAFSTRLADGADDFDLGAPEPPDPEVDARRRRLCAAAGLDPPKPAILRQQHGTRIVRIEELVAEGLSRADGLLLLREDGARAAAAVRTADCVPILLADEDGVAVAAVHAGWRGTALGVAARAVRMLQELGIPPGRLRAALGPSAGPCCYRVGDEVVKAVAEGTGLAPERLSRRQGDGGRTVDLAAANSAQLAASGVREGSISSAPWCTICSAGMFFSHRREGAAAGRQMACIGWSRDSAARSP
jgi:YfiH family protein